MNVHSRSLRIYLLPRRPLSSVELINVHCARGLISIHVSRCHIFSWFVDIEFPGSTASNGREAPTQTRRLFENRAGRRVYGSQAPPCRACALKNRDVYGQLPADSVSLCKNQPAEPLRTAPSPVVRLRLFARWTASETSSSKAD